MILAGLMLASGMLPAESISSGGLERRYLLSLPSGKGPWPLLIALHGGGGKAEGMEKLTGLGKLGKEEGFAVAFPDGIDKSWNDGRGDFKQGDADDVGFIADLRQKLVAGGVAEPSRSYLCGISNGGMMTLRMACEKTGLFAAAGVVSMSMSASRECQPSGKLPICFINGDSDPIVPFGGGPIKLFKFGRERGRVISVAKSIDFWVAQNGAAKAPDLQSLPDTDPEDGTRVELRRYAGQNGGPEVLAYTVLGGGHAWPGGWPYAGKWLIGRVSRDLNASRALWDFFKDKRRIP